MKADQLVRLINFASLQPAQLLQKLTRRDASGKVTQWGVQIPSSGFPYWLFQGLTTENGVQLMNTAGTETYYDKPEVIALNKCDLIDDELAGALAAELRAASSAPVFAVSGATGAGVDAILDALIDRIGGVGLASVVMGQER